MPINVNLPIVNPAELKEDKTISLRPVSNGMLLILNYCAFLYIFALLIILYGISMQYLGSTDTILNVTSIKFKTILGFEYLSLFFVGYYVFFIVIRWASYWTNRKHLTEKDFDGIEFKQIRRILIEKKLLYQEIAIYTVDQLKPHIYVLNHHDYWMIRDLWEASLCTQAEKKLIQSSSNL